MDREACERIECCYCIDGGFRCGFARADSSSPFPLINELEKCPALHQKVSKSRGRIDVEALRQ